MSIRTEGKSRKEQIEEFNESELYHLAKSGIDNPKIIDHFTKRIKEFLGLPEGAAFKPVIYNSLETFVDLGWWTNRAREEVEKLKQSIKLLEAKVGAPKENPSDPEDTRKNKPN